jgi:DNA processing protein
MSSHIAALIALQSIKGIGPKRAKALLEAVLPLNSYDLQSALEPLVTPGIVSSRWNDLCVESADIVNHSLDLGLKVIDYCSDAYPEILKRLSSPPLVIYIKGDLTPLHGRYPIAIVGSRNPCDFTKEHGPLVSGLAAQKSTSIVSGLAIGCDSIAHRAALLASVPTVAVVAHGLDSVYPTANKTLATEIVEAGGCLVSEYAIGIPPRPNQFIARDRIQAGLSIAGILLQSTADGGSMHAMRQLQKLNCRIGLLVPPERLRTTHEWGGLTELQDSAHTLELDPKSQMLSSRLDILIRDAGSGGGDERSYSQGLLF